MTDELVGALVVGHQTPPLGNNMSDTFPVRVQLRIAIVVALPGSPRSESRRTLCR